MSEPYAGAPVPADEPLRLEALRQACLLDTPAERDFDDLVEVAAALFSAPMALISLVDQDRQWFKSAVGIPRGETPRSVAFCAYVVVDRSSLVVEDATKDPRFASNPLVTGEPGIRFYAGAPLATADGQVLGTLCVIDHRPRTISPAERALLEGLARQVMRQVELRQKNRELARQEERLQLALQGGDLGVWDWNVATGRVTFDERWAAMLGYRLDEIEPHVRTWERLVHPEDMPRIMKELQSHLEGRTPMYRTEHRLRAKNGEWKWVLDSGKVFERDAQGKALRAAGTHLDLSAEKEARAALERRERQFREAQRLEAVGRLAGGVAHDFNNLLTVINGYSDMLRRSLAGDAVRSKQVGEIAKAGARAAELCASLLAFSRRQVLNVSDVDLAELVRSHAGMLRRLAGEEIELEFDLQSPGFVRADRGQLGQVLIHLVAQARSEMPAGGRITVRTRRSGEGASPAALLEVIDGGPGLPKGAPDDAFLPGGPAGLEMAAVYGIAAQSGGALRIEAVPGKGTTCTVELPQGGRAAPAVPAVVLPVPGGGGERVLLAEDSGIVRLLARQLLVDAGYSVVEAMNGDEALAAFEADPHSFDLLLTDIVMPGIRGTELANRLRAKAPGLKVLFMSGYPSDAVDPSGELEAKGEFLAKPFTPSALLEKVRSVLGVPAAVPR